MTIPKLSVIISDDEMRMLVRAAISDKVQCKYYKWAWSDIVDALSSTDDSIALLERLRVAYSIEV